MKTCCHQKDEKKHQQLCVSTLKMRVLFCVEMSDPIFGVVNSFLAFLYLCLSLAVFFCFHREREREREREQAYDFKTMSDQRRYDIMMSLRHWYNIVVRLCAH